eukprot:CAMPEP_0168744546 /NCGR_PEP_ID=MMETSP0724-20121128/14148_1 /TAXON_ID=265536 /ORGANISM="Amphiprora sp., Strain CCMP467" /LENGTH=261 /DNA_ID=CAMNT_0008792211 /DNA_START=52 /DNA_END=837 /DNA_ORIENTATION=+
MTNAATRQLLCNACALNNIGASLMQHGEYDKAVLTLKEALHTMKTYFRVFADGSAGKEIEDHVKTSQEKLRMSYARVAQASQDKANKNRRLTHEFRLVESNDFESLRTASLAQESNDSQVAIVIREPRHPEIDECAEIALAQESGIMLYNYALSAYYISRTTRRRKLRDSFYSIAREAMLLSYKTLGKRMMQYEDIVEDVESIFLSIFVLSCTSSMLRSRKEHSRAREAEDALCELLEAVEEENAEFLDAVSDGATTAAAA